MNSQHKDILRVNRAKLVYEIQDIKTVSYALEERGIITGPMLEDILAPATKTDKKRELLSILPRRGDEAFDTFYDVLVENKEGSAADILKPELASERKAKEKQSRDAARRPDIVPIAESLSCEDYDELPENWPDEKLVNEPFVLIKCEEFNPKYKEFLKLQQGSGNAYKHDANPRGIALVINNDKFEEARKNDCSLDDRDGTEKDLSDINGLLESLYYKVEIVENLTSEEITNCIKEYSKMDHGAFQSFLLFVLSHGEKETIYGIDGKLVVKEEIIKSFNGKNCPSLSGKPKLFFFQACQGKNKDRGVPMSSVEEFNKCSSNSSEVDNLELSLKKMKLPTKSDTVADVMRERSVAVEADVFIASATIPDYLSWRNTRYGTWFVQAIIYIFKKFSYKEDLNALMTKVNLLVSKGHTESGFLQVSMFETRLNKSFYFFPGLPPPETSLSMKSVQATD